MRLSWGCTYGRVAADNDRVDRMMLLAYLIYLLTILSSQFPRQSLDVAFSTLALVAVFHFARRELRDTSSRRLMFALLTAIALAVGAFALFSWGGRWVLWLTELGVPPPRGLRLSRRLPLATGTTSQSCSPAVCAPGAIGWPRQAWCGPDGADTFGGANRGYFSKVLGTSGWRRAPLRRSPRLSA